MMIDKIDDAKANGDSVGGQFEVIATGLPLWPWKLCSLGS